MFNLTKLALLWDWVNLLKKDSADVHGDLVDLDSRVDALEVTAPKDYSTTETATGQKWIDGKDIYCIAGSGSLGTITETTTIPLLTFTAETLVNAVVITGSDANKYVYTGGPTYSSNNNGLVSTFSTAYSGRNYTAFAYYTKPDPAPGRAPEDQEPEPEEKKNTKKKTSK